MRNRALDKLVNELVSTAVLVASDVLSYYIALLLATHIRNLLVSTLNVGSFNPSFNFTYFSSLWVFPLIVIANIYIHSLYRSRSSFWYEAEKYFKSLLLSVVLMFSFIGVWNERILVSRSVLLLWFVISLVVFPLVRYITKHWLYLVGVWQRRAVLIVDNRTSLQWCNVFIHNRYLGYEVVGYITHGDSVRTNLPVPYLGSNMDKVIKTYGIDVVIVLVRNWHSTSIKKKVISIYKLVDQVIMVPSIGDFSLAGASVFHVFENRMLVVDVPNMLHSFENKIFKWLIDAILGWIIFIFSCPLIAISALFVWLEIKTNPFYFHKRFRKDGRLFTVFKFQTMYPNADEKILKPYLKTHPKAREEWKFYKKLKGYDPRVTKIGAILRKTSLDELPQLLNVIMGQMSLVGPRPYLPRERDDIGSYFDIIMSVKPGITGLWQISGRSETTFDERLAIDEWYIRNWSLWLDIVILLKTVLKVFKREGAY